MDQDNDASLQAPRHRCIKLLPIEQCLETGLLLVSRVQCCPWVVVAEVVGEVVGEVVAEIVVDLEYKAAKK